MFGWLSAEAARLLSKAAHARLVPREGRGQKLQRRLVTERDVLGDIDLAHPARGERLDDQVVADGLTLHLLRSLVGNHPGGDVDGGRVDEAARLFVRRQKSLDLSAQLVVAGAGLGEEVGTLMRPARECGLEEFVYLLPALRGHK